MKVFKFAAGLAVGYVLGSRAGRDRYEQIVAAARTALDHPTAIQVRQKVSESLGTPAGPPAVTEDPAPADALTPGVMNDPAHRPARRRHKSPRPGTSVVTDLTT